MLTKSSGVTVSIVIVEVWVIFSTPIAAQRKTFINVFIDIMRADPQLYKAALSLC